MEIKEVKERAEVLKNDILKLISDFEVANSEVDVRVNVGRNYSIETDKPTHNVDINLSIK